MTSMENQFDKTRADLRPWRGPPPKLVSSRLRLTYLFFKVSSFKIRLKLSRSPPLSRNGEEPLQKKPVRPDMDLDPSQNSPVHL